MIDLIALAKLTIIQPIYTKPQSTPAVILVAPTPEVKAVTEFDNPQHCDENTQWIASEEPFYCIEKQVTPTPTNAVRPAVNSSGGNLYTAGQCTWGVKNHRPDIPNSWGNAYSWVYNAQAQGWPTGITPKVGAIGQSGNHVVYVEAINGDGTILIWEMNYDWVPYHAREIVKSAANYLYIY